MVSADVQTAGRGRLGRNWAARSGENVLCSLILRPDFPVETWGLITLAGAVAVVDSIVEVLEKQGFAAVQPVIKWPNDVLINGRKTCGMLLESVSGADAVILGIGVNVNQCLFDPQVQPNATSIALETHTFWSRDGLIELIARHLQRHYQSILQDGGAALRTAYLARLAKLGEPVSCRLVENGEVLTGILSGIDANGSLLLLRNGQLQTLHAGEVSFNGFS